MSPHALHFVSSLPPMEAERAFGTAQWEVR